MCYQRALIFCLCDFSAKIIWIDCLGNNQRWIRSLFTSIKMDDVYQEQGIFGHTHESAECDAWFQVFASNHVWVVLIGCLMTDGHCNCANNYYQFWQKGSRIRVVRALCRFIRDSTEWASVRFWTEVRIHRLGYHMNEETRVYSNDETTCSVDTEEVGLETMIA